MFDAVSWCRVNRVMMSAYLVGMTGDGDSLAAADIGSIGVLAAKLASDLVRRTSFMEFLRTLRCLSSRALSITRGEPSGASVPFRPAGLK